MSLYWETPFDKEQVIAKLQHGCDLFIGDKLEQVTHESMKRSFDSYEHRPHRMYYNGSCLGYTSDEVVQSLIAEGIVDDLGRLL